MQNLYPVFVEEKSESTEQYGDFRFVDCGFYSARRQQSDGFVPFLACSRCAHHR